MQDNQYSYSFIIKIILQNLVFMKVTLNLFPACVRNIFPEKLYRKVLRININTIKR